MLTKLKSIFYSIFRKIQVVDWVEYNLDVDIRKRSVGGPGGYFCNGMRWKDFLGAEEYDGRKYYKALREAILKNKYEFGGEKHQRDMAPLFNDGTVGFFSYRAWGDLMAAIWSEKNNTDYCYMDFYVS